MTEVTKEDGLRENRWRRWQWGLFLALLLVSLGLRLNGLARPAWIDEVFTLDWAEMGYADIFAANITPFMAATAKTMFVFFRCDAVSDELLVRLPHLVFGLLGIAAVYVLLRRRFGFVTAFAAALFLGTLPRHVAFSQEARYYAFAMLDDTLLLAAVLLCVRSLRPKALAFLFIASFMGTFNHLSFAFPLTALMGVGGVLLLLQPAASTGIRLRRVVLFCLVGVLGASAALLPSLGMLERGRLQGISQAVSVSEEKLAETGASNAPNAVKDGGTEIPKNLGDQEATAPTRISYTLGLRAYWSGYLGHYLGAGTSFALWASLLLAAVGMVCLIRADFGLAFMLAALLMIHVPFFIIKTGHTWSPRYFAVQIVALAILSGFGVAGLATLAQKSLSRFPVPGRYAAALVVLLYAAFLYAGRSDAYTRRHDGNTDQGQYALAQAIADQALPGDTIAIVGSEWGWQPWRVLKYYLERKLAHNPSLWYGLNWKHCATVAHLEPVAATVRGGSLWVVTQNEKRWPDGFAKMKRFPAAESVAADDSQLWVVGRETVNLLGGGDFEEPLDGVRLPEGGKIVEGVDAFKGGRSLKVIVSPATDVEKRPMPTVWFTPVRDPQGQNSPYLPQAGTVYSLSLMLKCADVVPGKFPSRTVRVVVEGKDISGKSFFMDFFRISGTRDWQRYEVQLEPGRDIPAEVKEFRVGIGNRGGSGTFWLDAVQLERQARSTPFTRDLRAAHKAGS